MIKCSMLNELMMKYPKSPEAEFFQTPPSLGWRNRPASRAGERRRNGHGPLGFLVWLAVAICWVAVSGCRSTEGGSPKALAAVVLRGNTPGQISQATEAVFREHGYLAAEEALDHLVFEKKGTRMENIEYGSWLGDEPVWVRVKVSIVPVGETAFRLQCRAFLVTNRGSGAEQELEIGRMHAGAYRKLLQEVAARLGQP